MDKSNQRYMQRALELASKAAEIGEVPVGAVVVKKNTGEIIGEGYNRRETDKSPLAHAEILAINEASKNLGGWRLIDCDMYVTLEPCAMCAGAIINSRIEKVYFGTFDPRFGAVGSTVNLFDGRFNHCPEIESGILSEECSDIIKEFFKNLRNEKKSKFYAIN